MRVILKPGGLAVLLSAIGVLCAIAMFHHANDRENTAQASAVQTDNGEPLAIWGGMVGGGSTLKDGNFAGPYVPARFFGNSAGEVKAKVSGTIADPWLDNSNWTDLSVRYGAETESNGSRSQRIEVGTIRSGRPQLVQYLHLNPNAIYQVHVRMRASEQVPAAIACIAQGGTSPDAKDVMVGTKWQDFTYTMPVTTTDNLLVFAFPHPNATVWVSNASIAIQPSISGSVPTQ